MKTMTLERLIHLYGQDILAHQVCSRRKISGSMAECRCMNIPWRWQDVSENCEIFPGEVDMRSLVRGASCMIISYTIGIYRMKVINGMALPTQETP